MACLLTLGINRLGRPTLTLDFNDKRKMYIPFVDDFQQNYTALYVCIV